MKKTAVLGVLGFTLAMVGAAQANQPASTNSAVSKAAKPMLHVVAGAKALTVAEKADVSGKCGCEDTPPPTYPVDEKPGYGFGTTGHYGPPGQGFNASSDGGPTWRSWVGSGNFDTTPAGHPLPGQALTRQ